jgi:hypothetical protein
MQVLGSSKEKQFTHNRQEANGISTSGAFWLWGSRHPISSHPTYSSSSCTKVGHIYQKEKKEEEEKEKEGKGLYTRPKKAEMTDEGIEAPKIFTQVLNLRRISLYCSL